jgi:multiple sugar transport system substrate-binding protein
MNQSTLSRRKLLRTGLGLGGVAILGAACARQPAAAVPTPVATLAPTAVVAATPAPAATAVPTPVPAVQIQVSTRGAGDGQIMAKTAEDFTAKTGIKVVHVAYGPEPDYWSKVEATFATKQLADVVWASTGNLCNFANRSILKPLDDIIATDKYDLTDYLPNALASLTLKGKLYAMPWGAHPGNGGLLYNVTLLHTAGFSNVTEDPESMLDWTYAKLMQAASLATRGMMREINTYGYLPGTDYLSLTNVIGAYGGDFMNADGTKLTMDSAEFLKGMNWVRDAFVTNKVAPAPDSNGDSLFDAQKVAMSASGYWGQFQPGITDNQFPWNDTLQPLGPAGKRGTHLTINGQTLSAVTQHPREAWEFVKFLMTPEQNVKIVLAGGGSPAARKSVLDSPELNEKMKAHKVWVKGLEAAEPWRQPANFRWPEFNSTITQVFADVWIGKQTVEQALPNATNLLQTVLDKPVVS